MSLLLDSHVLLWILIAAEDRVPPRVRELVEDPRERVVVSVASQWELMLKSAIGQLRLPEPPEQLLFDVVDDAGFRVLDVQPRHTRALAELPQIHADPFDRMLVAQALVEDMDLVTGDEILHRYPVRTIWSG